MLSGPKGKLKKQFQTAGGEPNYKIKEKIDDFHGGKLTLEIAGVGSVARS